MINKDLSTIQIMYNIEYKVAERRDRINDGYSQVLREAAEYFADKSINMTSKQGFEEILSENSLFDTYKSLLCEGMEPDQVENFKLLMDNSRFSMLQEANVSGVQQIAGLSMPTIRKMWAKVSLKHAIPTQVAATPRFAISYTKAYVMDAAGNKYELPDAINNLHNDLVELPRIPKDLHIELNADGTLKDHDLFQYVTGGGFTKATPKDTIDKVFYVENVTVSQDALAAALDDLVDSKGQKVTDIDTAEEIGDIRVHCKTDQQALIWTQVKIPLQKTNPASGIVTKYGELEDTLFGRVDYSNGTITLTSINGTIASVTLDCKVSMETNEFGESVSFDILTKDITIGVGSHINAPLPIEWLQDTMAIYNIDGAAEVVDLMSQTVAQKLELEIYNFLKKSIEINNITYLGEFNLIPSAGYNGTPKSWREELKTVIDYFAQKMKKDSKFHGGKFMIIGSPIDMMLLPNVDWVFNHTDNQMSGVDVSFNLGAFSGGNRYEMVCSDLLPEGELIMFFVPGIDRLMTYKYYPYTFNVERGYRDPNMPNVPSIMMTKRHTIEEFTPLICSIKIKNNIGAVPATPGY